MKQVMAGLLAAVSIVSPVSGAEAERHKVFSSISVDFDGDGKMDKAELVLVNPVDADATLNGGGDYVASDAERVDLVLTFDAASGKPAFVKKKIVDPEEIFIVSALESKSKGSVSVRSCYGCGATKSWDKTLTIAYRGGHFVVAGLNRDWEWGTHLAGGNFELIMGGCEINYLTGEGTISKGLSPGRAVKKHFKRIKLADWSDANIPKVCEFY